MMTFSRWPTPGMGQGLRVTPRVLHLLCGVHTEKDASCMWFLGYIPSYSCVRWASVQHWPQVVGVPNITGVTDSWQTEFNWPSSQWVALAGRWYGFLSLVSSRDLINSPCLKSVRLISYLTRFRTLVFSFTYFPREPRSLNIFQNTSII